MSRKARVMLFKPSGKFYCSEEWDVPVCCLGPSDMAESWEARSIDGGPVLVFAQQPWGFPALLMDVPARSWAEIHGA